MTIQTNPWLALSGTGGQPNPAADKPAWVLLVVGSEHRVGASVTSLALAEAAGGLGLDVLLVDAAVPRWSGLRSALATEGPRVARDLAVCEGRRGSLPIRSAAFDGAELAPADFLVGTEDRDLVVVDAGATLAGSAAWLGVVSAWLPVVAVTYPGLARAEAALDETAAVTPVPPAGVAGITTSLDPRGSAGRLLGQALDRQWAPMPRHGDVEASGATPAPLPYALVDTAGRLLQGVLPEGLAVRGPAPSQRGFWRRNR